MGDYTNSFEVSKNPIIAQADWKEISVEKKKECKNCGSLDTICVYSYFSGSNIGWTKEDEYYCNKCSHYTLYTMEYDS